jgi:hypothetical protein
MSNTTKTVETDGPLAKIPRKWFLSVAGTFAVCLLAGGFNALGQSPVTEGQTRYKARQSISYEFGSKFTSGYFVRHAGTCLVTLMVIEKSPPDHPLPITAARVRLSLLPGQIAGLDSEEGHSLNFTCSEDATALVVDTGERDNLAALQRNAHTGGRGAS